MTRLELLREAFNDYELLRGKRAGLDDLPELSLVAMYRKSAQVVTDRELFEKVTNVLAGEVHGRAWFRQKLRWTGNPSLEEGGNGWARFRSELGWTDHPPPCFEQSGPPIMAEWLDGGISYRLTPAPSVAGQALVVSACARSLDPLDPNDCLREGEEPGLRQRLEILADPRVTPFTHIAYEVCWGLPSNDSSSAMRRLFDRFAGFIINQEG